MVLPFFFDKPYVGILILSQRIQNSAINVQPTRAQKKFEKY